MRRIPAAMLRRRWTEFAIVCLSLSSAVPASAAEQQAACEKKMREHIDREDKMLAENDEAIVTDPQFTANYRELVACSRDNPLPADPCHALESEHRIWFECVYLSPPAADDRGALREKWDERLRACDAAHPAYKAERSRILAIQQACESDVEKRHKGEPFFTEEQRRENREFMEKLFPKKQP